MMTHSNKLAASVSLTLATGTVIVAGAIVVWRFLPPGLSLLAFVVLGMLTMATMAAIERYAEESDASSRGKSYQLAFDESVVEKMIEGFGEAPKKVPYEHIKPSPPWELNAGQLVGVDDELALAKLRMDIEREVRLLAFNANIDLSNRLVSVNKLAAELHSKNILSPGLVSVIKDVVTACNQAIHGQPVSAEDATKIVRVGGQLLGELRLRAEVQ